MREKLKEIQELDHEIDELVEKKKYYFLLVTKITPSYKTISVQETANSGKLDDYMCKVSDILDALEKKLDQLDTVRNEIDQAIEKIPDVQYRRLLRLRYFHGNSWEEIQKKVYPNYSEQHVRGYLHGRALRELEKVKRVNTY